MTMIVACLHTADSNIALLDAVAQDIGVTLLHRVRADLLAEAEQAGGLTTAIADATEQALRDLAQHADAVLLTCSTLGPVVTRFPATARIYRTDAALADAAMAIGGKITILCAAPTTLAATSDLFTQVATGQEVQLDLQLVPDAWTLFKAGQQNAYWRTIAAAANNAYQAGADIVVLAQASMAGAANLVTEGPTPLTSPATGLSAALRDYRASYPGID